MFKLDLSSINKDAEEKSQGVSKGGVVSDSKPKVESKGRVLKTFIQYVTCLDIDTKEEWMESFKSFPASESFLEKRLNKKQLASRQKQKIKDKKPKRVLVEAETQEEVL